MEEESGAPLLEGDLEAMRKAGLPKPDGVSWSEWLGPKKITARHHLICYLAAMGGTTAQIADQTGLSTSRVSLLLNNPKIKNEIRHIQKQMFGEDPRKKFSSLLQDTIEVQEEIMKNRDEKGATRLTAASQIQDRALGKAPQQIEIGGNLIRALFDRMDQKKKEDGPAIFDVTPETPLLPLREEIGEDDPIEVDVEAKSVESTRPRSGVDSWMDDFLGDGD